MTVTLTPDIETRLRAYAEDLDLDPEQVYNALLSRALEEAEFKDTMDGLDRSMADVAAGRWLTSEEFDRRMEAKVVAARAKAAQVAETGIAKCTGTGSAGLLVNESRSATTD